jgi:hypothetical protein
VAQINNKKKQLVSHWPLAFLTGMLFVRKNGAVVGAVIVSFDGFSEVSKAQPMDESNTLYIRYHRAEQ